MPNCQTCRHHIEPSPGGEETADGWICGHCIDAMDGEKPVCLYAIDELRREGFTPEQSRAITGLRFWTMPSLNQCKAHPEILNNLIDLHNLIHGGPRRQH